MVSVTRHSPNSQPQDQGNADFRLHGRRKVGRLSARQQNLLEEMLPVVRLAVSNGNNEAGCVRPWPPFRDTRPLWLEIGFGKGEHLAHQAGKNPEIGLIGAEPFQNGIASLLSHIDQQKLSNIRIYPDDARILINALPDACLDRVFLLHPDPWPKTRHAKRRFINVANIKALARVMNDGAELRLQTDHMGFARWALVHLSSCPYFLWTAERPADWQARPDDWAGTRYEEKAEKDGRRSVYLRFERLPRRST